MNKRICIATLLYQVDPIVYSSHLNMMYKVGKNLPGWEVIFVARWRMAIADARNFFAETALYNDCSLLFCYDDDAMLDPNVVERLINRIETTDADIVMGETWVRGYPYKPMIFRFVNKEQTMLSLYDYREEDILENGLVEVDAVGCHNTIIKTELFKEMSKPYFFTGQHNTEDVYFCLKARETYESVRIYMDSTFNAGHLGDKRIITKESRQNLIDDYKRGYDCFGLPIEKKDSEDLDIVHNTPFDEGE